MKAMMPFVSDVTLIKLENNFFFSGVLKATDQLFKIITDGNNTQVKLKVQSDLQCHCMYEVRIIWTRVQILCDASMGFLDSGELDIKDGPQKPNWL